MRALVTVIACAALTACSAQPRLSGTQRDRIERTLATAPGQAQPVKVVAAELAFARAAREKGQWTAFREFLAPGALLHGAEGAVDARDWLAQAGDDPDVAVQWAPRTIWMSCDGKLAVSQGRLRNGRGQVGSFVTVWEQRSDGEYRWIYDTGALDDPQPPPREAAEEGAIIVTAIDAVQGNIADCPPRGETPPAPAFPLGDETASDISISSDGTLAWRWNHFDGAARSVDVQLWLDGEWQSATPIVVNRDGKAPRS